jgi:hypothetical protein
MKKIIIGALVATIIYFGWQTCMWMSGAHNDFSRYTPKQDSILTMLSSNLSEEGAYFMPYADPQVERSHEEQEAMMKEKLGKPWAMIFYHPSMKGEGSGIIMGLIYNFFASWMVCMILYHGGFNSFGMRFLVSMTFAVFAMIQGIGQEMNWWSFPWHFEKAAFIDLIAGWLLASVWLAWFVRKPVKTS